MHEPQLNFRLDYSNRLLDNPSPDEKNLHENKKKQIGQWKNDESILNMIIVNDDQSKTPLTVAGCWCRNTCGSNTS